MVHLGYDGDEERLVLELAKQKYTLHKPVTPYICSTPCDFDEERKYLTNIVFPQLREICLKRGTAFSPIDIQWTPDSQQVKTEQLLCTNLDFVTKCSPYFLCLLGETYGPHRLPESEQLPKSIHDLKEDASWLARNYLVAAEAGYSWILKEVHQNCSIPELEIIQGAFLNDNYHCHFYYRQPEHLDHKFPGLTQAEKVLKYKLYKPESEYADLNIRDLKQRIINKGLPVKYFQTCKELGVHVLTDWKAIIDELYPPLLEGPSIFDTEEYQEWLCHEVFSESRGRVYLNHSELRSLMEKLNEFCRCVLDEPFLELEEEMGNKYIGHMLPNHQCKQAEVVLKTKSIMLIRADRGMGKSSLVANWVKQFSAENPEIKVISYFVGSSGRSRDVTTAMRRFVAELREEYLFKDADGQPADTVLTKQTFKELSGSFQAALSLGPCVIVIDGVDELGASLGMSPQEVKCFSWIPLPLPAQCRIILTTLKSDCSYTSLMKRPDTEIVTISNLNMTKVRAEFLEDHMNMHFEHLKRSQLQTIFESKLSGKPLFLRIIGNEMCSYSVYMNLDVYTENIRDTCASIRDLFTRCIQRWSRDHSWTYEVLSAEQMEREDVDFIGWVPDVLRLLAVSRSGLEASEILEILESIGYQENVKVTQYDWWIFQLCLRDNITESPFGRLNLSHQHLREIVEYVLLKAVKPSTAEIICSAGSGQEWKKQKAEFHQHLVQYFRKGPHDQRQAEELPWQLLMAGDMKGLLEILTEPGVFVRLYDAEGKYPSNYNDLHTYWYYLDKEGFCPIETYRKLLIQLGALAPDPVKLENLSMESIASGEDITDETLESQSEIRLALSPTPIMLFTSSSPTVPNIFTTPAPGTKLSVIEKASNMSRDDRNCVDSMFITQEHSKATGGGERDRQKYDLSPTELTSLMWYISQFLIKLGHEHAAWTIVMDLNSRLAKSHPLTIQDQLIQAKVLECLGQQYLNQNYIDMAEKYYKKALQTVIYMSELEDSNEIHLQLQMLKGKILLQVGYLCMQQELLKDADDLFQEALDLAEATHDLPLTAFILYQVGNLRIKQYDYLMAETNLSKCLLLRQKWYGKSHPLVADVLFSLGTLMADENNNKGYDKAASSDALQRCLEIREFHLDKDHLQVAQVLFELGKLLKNDTSYTGRTECQNFLCRALDIRIIKLGGEHIETKAVRQYLNNLESSLKVAKHDARSSERPFSALSWRSHDLANMEKRTNIQSGKSSSYGLPSRPGSQLSRTGSHISLPTSQNALRSASGVLDSMSPKHSIAHLPASERLLLESNKLRLLQRDTVCRRLNKDYLSRSSPNEEEKKQIHVKLNTDHIESNINYLYESSGVLLDSFGQENSAKSSSSLQKSVVKLHQEIQFCREMSPKRIFQRFFCPPNNENGVTTGDSATIVSHLAETVRSDPTFIQPRDSSLRSKQQIGSASSRYTSVSGISLASHRSNCDIPRGPHSLHISNARTTTVGPHSSVVSLLGNTGPKDISKGIHHKSAWYHIPGRYTTMSKKYPPKRSQKRDEAIQLEKSIVPVTEDPYVTFMRSNYRKNNPRILNKGYPGNNGHTCGNVQMFVPYPRHDKKKYVICAKCQKHAEEIVASKENELFGYVKGGIQNNVNLLPTVSGLTIPDRPREANIVQEEPMTPDNIPSIHPHVVTFKDAIVIN